MSNFIARKAAQSRRKKQEAWQAIQAKAPELAGLIQALAARTGRLKYVRVRFADGGVVEFGERGR